MFVRRAVRLCVVRLPGGLLLEGTLNPRRQDFLLEGTATMPDGRKFSGRFDEQHGYPLAGCRLEEDGDLYQGRLEQHDFTYEGEFHDNKPHGRGRLVFATGGEQEGTFFAGKLHGSECKMKLDGGFVYVGEFVDGHIKRGRLFTHTYTYDGEFNEHGRAHGEGTQTYLANEPRLLFTGIWDSGALIRGTCSDEYGTPVDWQENHELQAKLFSEEGGASAVTMNSYGAAKLKEADRLYREMNKSYTKDASDTLRETGRFPSKMDLGYEGSIRQEQEALEHASHRCVNDLQTTRAALEVKNAEAGQLCASVVEESTISIDPKNVMMQFAKRDAAQQLAAEHVDEQFERFMKTFDQHSETSISRRIIDGNAPWKAYTSKQ
uniref:Phosphatidylinositol-4-phosphate 5-kinase related n=1 Tax=Trypanosoma vivax (strain Y486) TaxID=1055687 RepID=G0TR05_TRYVY|nr:conserved hypothetical protein, fragment [Trypanosoma vivax Y486]